MSKSAIIECARMAEKSGRYEDMANLMKQAAETEVELKYEELRLLASSYKQDIFPRRKAWKIVSNLEKEHVGSLKDITIKYCKDIENEIKKICQEVLGLLATRLVPSSPEHRLFLLTMKANFTTYLAEIATGYRREFFIEEAEKCFEEAVNISKNIISTHPFRLDLYLNLAVFHFELTASPEKACQLAKHAIDEAIAELPTINEEFYKHGSGLLELLRENLTAWSTNLELQVPQAKKLKSSA